MYSKKKGRYRWNSDFEAYHLMQIKDDKAGHKV